MANRREAAMDVRSLDGGLARISAEALEAFIAGHSGPVLRDGDAGYEDARRIWNDMIDRRPALIARAQGPDDVVHAIRFARSHGLLTSVKGGGHNIAGLSTCDGGLVLDLSLQRGVSVDPERRVARVAPGCTLSDVDRATQAHGLAAVLGFVSTTGVAGLTVGGGFGYLTRQHGWTCDNVVSMDVVTADGNLVRASHDENAELFWCLRGGGGNFGVVTSFEYQLHEVGPDIYGGAIAWRGDDALAVLEAYAELTRTAPRELTAIAILRTAPKAPWLPAEVHGLPIAAVFVCHRGARGDGERLLAKLRATGKPVADIVKLRPYVEMQSLIDATQPKGRRYYWKSDYFAELGEATLRTYADHAARAPSPHSAIIAVHLKGALNELSPDHCPAGNRDAAFVVNVAGSWENAVDDATNIAWAREAWAALHPLSTGGAYLNFLTEEEGAERIEAAYGRATLERLSAAKARLDPDGLFRHNKGFDAAR